MGRMDELNRRQTAGLIIVNAAAVAFVAVVSLAAGLAARGLLGPDALPLWAAVLGGAAWSALCLTVGSWRETRRRAGAGGPVEPY